MLVVLSVLVCQLIVSSSAGSQPQIEFTSVPAYGSSSDLEGRVRNVDPDSFRVAVYIFPEGAGWWVKPTFPQPCTDIRPDSFWTADITTGGADNYAMRICAFLIPESSDCPLAGGLCYLPDTLYSISVDSVCTTRTPKTIAFSGYEWWVKKSCDGAGPGSCGPVGPGSNFFSDDTENIWVDSLTNDLHLKITYRNGRWYCSEVILKDMLVCSTYAFQVNGPIDALDPNVVLGLFIYDDWDKEACMQSNREFDIEFSRWGNPLDTNAQYVRQPWNQPGNRRRWIMPPAIDSSTHVFFWSSDSIAFLSAKGHQSCPPYDSIVYSWVYTGSVPTRGNEHVRINLWLVGGGAPTDSEEVEVIITRFECCPPTEVEEQDAMPITRFALSQNNPNPFHFRTSICYDIPTRRRVSLKVYDIAGRLVETLVAEESKVGSCELQWDGRNHLGEEVHAGIYFYRLTSAESTLTKKMVLLR